MSNTRFCQLQIGLIGLLPFLFLFFKTFSSLIILAKTERHIQVERMETLVFLPTLEEMVYFSSFSLMFSAGFLQIFFIMLKNAPSVSSFFGLLNFSKTLPICTKVFLWLCIIQCLCTDLWMLSHFFKKYFSSVKSNWLRCMIFLTSCWIWFASISFENFASGKLLFFFCWIVFWLIVISLR